MLSDIVAHWKNSISTQDAPRFRVKLWIDGLMLTCLFTMLVFLYVIVEP